MMLFSNKKREYTYTYVISSDWAGRARFRLESCAGSRLKSALEVRQSTPAGAQSKRSYVNLNMKFLALIEGQEKNLKCIKRHK